MIRKTNVPLCKQREDMTLPPARGPAVPSAMKTSKAKITAGDRKEGVYSSCSVM